MRVHLLGILGLLPLLVSRTDSATPSGINLGSAHRVNAQDGVRHEIVWARADRTDPRYMMACGMYEDPRANTVGGYLFISSDGGITWRQSVRDAATDWVSEESCTYGVGGNAYFTTGESNTDDGTLRHEYGRFQLFVSRDHGMSWRKTVSRGFVDWTYATVLMPTAEKAERLVVFGNETVSSPGHWNPAAPVAFESTDGGVSLQGPVSVPRPRRFDYVGEYAFGTAVLPDGSVLFSAASRLQPHPQSTAKSRGSLWTQTANAELFKYSPRLQTLRSFAILRRGDGIWSVVLARADGKGMFGGPLFAGWIESKGSRARAMLAISRDNGRTWSLRQILRGSAFRAVMPCSAEQLIQGLRVAVDNAGALGVSWVQYGQGMYFAVSHDGGRTFSRSTEVARYPHTWSPTDYARYLQAVPIDEYSGALAGFEKKDSAIAKLQDVSGIGIAVRVDLLNYADASDLVADAAGRFHAFWSQPGGAGQALWTRTISVGLGKSQGKAEIGQPAVVPSTECTGAPKLVFPRANPGRDPSLAHGWRDASRQIGLRLSNLDYNAATQDVALDVRFINLGKRPLRGDVMMTADDIHSDLGRPEPLDAQQTFPGGATWDVSRAFAPTGVLQGRRSQPFGLQFHIADFRPAQPQAILDAVAMGIKVYRKQ